MDLFKYIFDSSNKDGLKGIISVIIKAASFFICICPVGLYCILYQNDFTTNYNIAIVTTVIIGCSCILMTIVFLCSKAYAYYIVLKKFKNNTKMTDDMMLKYYFKISFIISILFQGGISVSILFIYFYNHETKLNYLKIDEIFIIIMIFVIFILIAVVLWIKSLLKYIDNLENSSELVVKRMLNNGQSIDLISSYTGLSKEKIEKIKKYTEI